MGIPLLAALLLFYFVAGWAAKGYDGRARITLFSGTAVIIGLFYAFLW